MIERIKEWDTQLFLYLNGANTPVLDTVMYWITHRFTWIPLYLLIIVFLLHRYRLQALWILLALIATITLADQVASGFFKPYFGRSRPCYEEAIQALVHVVGGCGGQFGFVSSHSANTFALATFLWLLLGRRYPGIVLFYVWAGLVSYSRIYVGVHYPLDLIGGALVGSISAGLVYAVYFALNRRRKPLAEDV
jgi:undecaprenyl-diphosphatase